MEETALLGAPFLWIILLVIPVALIFGLSKWMRKTQPDDKGRPSATPDITDVAEPYDPPKVQNKDEL